MTLLSHNHLLRQYRFEADERIKYHTERVEKRLNAEWVIRMKELKAHFEEEKRSLIKFYESGGRVKEDGSHRFKFEDYDRNSSSSIDNRVHGFDHHSAVNRGKQTEEMMKVPTRYDEEQHYFPAVLPEQMENTRHVNSECSENAEDKESRMERMNTECLKALDLQRELLLCRHITEILHMMAIIRHHDDDNAHHHELSNDDVEQSAEFHTENVDVQPPHCHQSKSINSTDDVEMQANVNKSNEEKIFNERQPQSNRRSIDFDGEGGEATDLKVNTQKLFQQRQQQRNSSAGRYDGSEWATKSSKRSVIRNSFIECILNRFVSHHISSTVPTIEPFTSQRENDYEKKSNPPPRQRTMAGEKATFDPSTADVDEFLLPKAANALAAVVPRMKDSLEISSQSTTTTQRDGAR